jgi:hypothetical protein
MILYRFSNLGVILWVVGKMERNAHPKAGMPPIRIFFSYAHADDEWRDRLRKQLRPWERQGEIVCWCDRQIPPGGEWKIEIETQLSQADIILLLVSPDFLDSDFCMEQEYPRAIARHESEGTCVIPVLLRPCLWKRSIYNTLQAYPKDLVPVTSWRDSEDALQNIAEGILAAVEIRIPKPPSEPKPTRELTEQDIEDRYLESQRYAVEEVRSEGIAQQEGIFTTLLEEVFVPLGLGTTAVPPGFMPYDWERCDRLNIWDFLSRTDEVRHYRQMVILAWGGFGKTTLLRHITYIYSTRQQTRYGSLPARIPVLLTLRKHRKTLAQAKPPGLADLIATVHAAELPGGQALPVKWVQTQLRAGRMVILLDGFDEVAIEGRGAIAHWITEQMRAYPQAVFILTSRPKAYKETARLELATLLWVQEFDADQRKDFVERWYLCQERYNSGFRDTLAVRHRAEQAAAQLLAQIEAPEEAHLRDLAKNPLLLTMLLRFHRRYPKARLPKLRVELYREICQLQLQDRPDARDLETLLTDCDAQTILQLLALEMMQRREERLERSELLRRLTIYLEMQSENVDATEFLDQVEQVSELLVRQDEGYEFAHLSFQEYLAATQVAQQQESLLYEYLTDDWWKQTILLYATQVNPTSLIQTAMERGLVDLAYTFMQETTRRLDETLKASLEAERTKQQNTKGSELRSPRQRRAALQGSDTDNSSEDLLDSQTQARLEQLKQTVEDSRFQKLEELLRSQEWVKADKETYRLMLTAVGKEEGQWFEREKLLNFPCSALKTIDHLWVHYSNGRFGFSVQKEIYVDCGGRLDGKYPPRKVAEAFGKHVGWWEWWEERWLRYSDVTLRESHKIGVFPCSFWWGVGGGGVGVGVTSFLAYRLVNCSATRSVEISSNA